MDRQDGVGEWVLLTYQLPREPSTPRIALWRRLKRLGVAQLGDGLVALPADARTREQIEWIADEVIEGGGQAALWLARPASAAQERALAAAMARARAAEYLALTEEATAHVAAGADQARLLPRLRRQWREITRRDYFPPAERDAARAALQALADTTTTWVTFVPCFLFIFLGAPYVERLRGNEALSAQTRRLLGLGAALLGLPVG